VGRQVISEFLGTALLLAVITGSGIMGDNLSQGNDAYVLITLLGPISGAHFNPAVSLMFWRAGTLESKALLPYILAQLSGGVVGVWVTHVLFDLRVMQLSTNPRSSVGIWVSELVSTLALLGVIWLGVKVASEKVAILVAMSVTAGYWFTSSTFFANPAVALARGFTNTFVGIMPADVPAFIAAQILAVIIICFIIKTK